MIYLGFSKSAATKGLNHRQWVVGLALLLSLASGLAQGCFAAAQPPPVPPGVADAGAAALKAFVPVMQRSSPACRKNTGFSPTDDLNKLVLGAPFSPRLLIPDAIAKYKDGEKVGDSLIDGGSWYFPVLSNGHIACLLTVSQKDGRWMEDKLGMAALAHAWSAVCEAWPADQGYTPILVIVTSHTQFLFTVPQAAYPNLTRMDVNVFDNQSAPDPKLFKNVTKAADTFLFLRGQKQ